LRYHELFFVARKRGRRKIYKLVPLPADLDWLNEEKVQPRLELGRKSRQLLGGLPADRTFIFNINE
jgi:hypothetical protein